MYIVLTSSIYDREHSLWFLIRDQSLLVTATLTFNVSISIGYWMANLMKTVIETHEHQFRFHTYRMSGSYSSFCVKVKLILTAAETEDKLTIASDLAIAPFHGCVQ